MLSVRVDALGSRAKYRSLLLTRVLPTKYHHHHNLPLVLYVINAFGKIYAWVQCHFAKFPELHPSDTLSSLDPALLRSTKSQRPDPSHREFPPGTHVHTTIPPRDVFSSYPISISSIQIPFILQKSSLRLANKPLLFLGLTLYGILYRYR